MPYCKVQPDHPIVLHTSIGLKTGHLSLLGRLKATSIGPVKQLKRASMGRHNLTYIDIR